MLAAFATQQAILTRFSANEERYRVAPRYEFRRPPHAGTLHYERWGWTLEGVEFRKLVSRALRELGLA